MKKLSNTKGTANKLKSIREREQKSRETYYNIQDFIFRSEESLYTIDEKLEILKNEYPPSQNYVQVSTKVIQDLDEIKETVENFENVITKVDSYHKQLDYRAADNFTETLLGFPKIPKESPCRYRREY